MRLGLIGSGGNPAMFARAFDALIERGVDRVVYLGDDGLASRFVAEQSRELFGQEDTRTAFFSMAQTLADRGEPSAIRALLAAESRERALRAVLELPPAPGRAVELLDERVGLFVYDKSTLDEDDIVTASLVVYGKASASDVRHFGSRTFLTPGPLSAGRIATLAVEGPGRLEWRILSLEGEVLTTETLAQKRGRVSVSS